MQLDDSGFLDIGSQHLEYRMIGPRPDAAPTIVLLHQGLGCVGLWGDFPEKLQQTTGCGVFVYSRAGYGLPRPLSFKRGLLLGDSDGGSIAAIYAGSHQDHRVGGLVLIAPHFFTEDHGIESILQARMAYESGDLRQRLARWHTHVDNAFQGWSGAWLDPDFRKWDITEFLAYIRVPVLIVQGEDDQYGTVKQIEMAKRECYCPVEVALLAGTRHSPQHEAPEATLQAITGFVARVLEANAWPAAA